MATLDEVLAQAKPVTRTVRLCLRGDLIAERERAERDLYAARFEDERVNEPPTAPAIAQRIVDLETQQDAATIEVEIRAVGRTEWEETLDAHPPDDAQKEKGLNYSTAFPSVAVAAAMWVPTDEGLTQPDAAQVDRLFKILSEGQFVNLWNAVLAVNMGDTELPKSVAATTVLSSSEPKSITASPEESLGVSS